MNLDLKKFKKIDSDDNVTILEHPNQHQIKVAHKGLSPEMRKELDELPLHLAKGGAARYSKHAQAYDPTINPKGARPSQVAKSSSTMPGSPTMAKDNYTEPGDIGTPFQPNKWSSQKIEGAPSQHEKDDISLGVRNNFYKEHGKYPPCLNSSCRSFLRPHPNCHCYGPSSEAGNKNVFGSEVSHYSDGGEVENYCSKNRPHQKDCQYFASGGESRMLDEKPKEEIPPVEAPQEPTPELDPSPTPAPVAQADINPNPEVSATPGPASTPQSPEIQAPQQADVPPTPAVDPAMAHATMLKDQALKTQADLDNGHISPKTYKDLFNDKDFLGKTGTIFGLLMSGMGSGLSHQPNMLMQMMDNQIQNDLNAQEKSAGNRQNFMTIAQKGLLNQSEVTGKDIANATNTRALAWSAAARTSLHNQIQMAQKLPEGSQSRYDAMQALSVLSKSVDAKEADMFSQAGLAQAQMEAGKGFQGQGGTKQGPVDYNKFNQLQRNSKMGLPGAPSEQDINSMTQESDRLEKTRTLRKDFEGGFNSLDKMALAGKLSPNARAAVVKTLAAKAAPIVGVGHANDLIESMMPQASDWGKTKSIKQKSNSQYFDVLDAGNPTLKRFGLINPAQNSQNNKPQNNKPQSVIQNGHTYHLDPATGKYK